MKFITFLTTTLLAILTLSPEAFAQSNPPKCPPGEIPVTHLMSQIKSNIMKLYVKDITHIDDASGCVSKNALNLITTFDTIKLYKKYNSSSKLSNASIDNDINTAERILKMLKNNLSIDQIAAITDKTADEIQAIAENQKPNTTP